MDRTVPDAPEAAEQIGPGCLLNPAALPEVRRLISPADILAERPRAFYGAVLDAAREGITGDPVAVALRLKTNPAFVDSHDANKYIAEAGRAAVPSQVVRYAREVREARRKRWLQAMALDAAHRSCNGESIDSVINDLWAGVDDIRRDGDTRERFPMLTARELDRGDFSIHYAVDRALVIGQPIIVAGMQKVLKTSIICDKGISLATGTPFLGKFEVSEPRSFVLFSAESGLATLQQQCRAIARERGIELGDVPNFSISTALPQLDSDSDMAAFEAAIEGRDVAFLDPAFLMMSGDDAGNLFKQGAQLRKLTEVGERTGTTIGLCHHAKRTRHGAAEHFDPVELADIAWSGFAEWARQWLLIGRREAYEPGSGQHRLWLTLGGSAGHNSLWAVDINEGNPSDPNGRRWEVDLYAASEARSQADQRRSDAKAAKAAQQLEDDRNGVCRVLAKQPGGMTPTAIRDAVGISGRRFPSVLSAMIEANEIEPCEVRTGNQKSPKAGYRLTDNDAT